MAYAVSRVQGPNETGGTRRISPSPVCTHDLLLQLALPCDPDTDQLLRERKSISPPFTPPRQPPAVFVEFDSEEKRGVPGPAGRLGLLAPGSVPAFIDDRELLP